MPSNAPGPSTKARPAAASVDAVGSAHQRRFLPALVSALLVTLAIAPSVMAAHVALGGNVEGNYRLYDPRTNAWITGNAKDYSEGEIAALSIGFRGTVGQQFKFTVCNDYKRSSNGAFGFVNIDDFDTTYAPPIRGTAISSRLGGVAADTKASLDTVTYLGVNPSICGSPSNMSFIAWEIEFTVTATATSGSPGYIYIGLQFGEPGVTTAAGETIGAGKGVADLGLGNIASFLKDTNGNRTVTTAPGDIIRRADLGVVTNCPDFFSSPPYTYQAVVSNSGASPATNLVMVYTLPNGVSYAGFTSTPTSSCSASGQVVTCTLSSLAVSGSWTVNMQVTLNTGTSGSLTGTVTSLDSDETDPVPSNNTDTCASTTPVVVSYFEASSVERGTIDVQWRSESEVDVVGYNLLGSTGAGLVRLNAEPIPAALGDGSEDSNDYGVRLADTGVRSFYLEALHGNGNNISDGPFYLGQPEGSLDSQPAVPWSEIRTEHETRSAERDALHSAQVQARIADWASAQAEQRLFSLGAASPRLMSGANEPAARSVSLLDLTVNRDGVQRITYEDLLSAGYDLSGLPASDLALTATGIPVPIRVAGAAAFGPGSYIEWLGEAADTLYTKDNVYRLHIDSARAERVDTATTPPARYGVVASSYMETAELEPNALYRLWSSNPQDPWLATDLLVFGSPSTWSYELEIDAYVPGAARAQLEVELMGFTRLAANPDHHLFADVNGMQVDDITFDGAVRHVALADLPDGLLSNGANTVSLTNPADLGLAYDYSGLDSIRIHYPRAFLARNDTLAFDSGDRYFMVRGLSSPNVLVYERHEGGVTRITGLDILPMGGGQYAVRFDGTALKGQFWVVEAGAAHMPGIRPVRPDAGIDQGAAQVLVISHADFLTGLAPWVSAREAQGFQVRTVDIADVIDRFGHGVFGVDALRDYIRFAAAEMGTESVLLVGSDSYDYHGYMGSGAISFVPTIYTETDPQTKFAPADPLLGDLDDDGVPELAVGRWPVRTAAQLADVVNKTLLYDDSAQPREAVFAADEREDYADFSADSNAVQDALPASWQGERAHIDTLGAGGARTVLLDKLNAGMRIVSFFGHSSSRSWTRRGLLTASDAMNLQNTGRPSAIVQWGCWNTYYVNPAADSMGHRFLLSNDRGAALVLGATTLTRSDSERELGVELMPRLMTPGQTVGQAMIEAKRALDARLPDRVDVQAGWALLGDPTVVIER